MLFTFNDPIKSRLALSLYLDQLRFSQNNKKTVTSSVNFRLTVYATSQYIQVLYIISHTHDIYFTNLKRLSYA